MSRKTGGSSRESIWPAEVRLIRSRQPLAKSSSATRTANDAPTAKGTIPTVTPAASAS
jgi:hypothetical protein